jgi:hypothetical protein
MSPVDLRRTPTACTTPPEFIEPRPWEPQPTIRLGNDAAGLALTPLIGGGATLIAHVEHPDGPHEDPVFMSVPLSENDLAALSVAAWALKQDAERARGAR